jgi:hypothetical protein
LIDCADSFERMIDALRPSLPESMLTMSVVANQSLSHSTGSKPTGENNIGGANCFDDIAVDGHARRRRPRRGDDPRSTIPLALGVTRNGAPSLSTSARIAGAQVGVAPEADEYEGPLRSFQAREDFPGGR